MFLHALRAHTARALRPMPFSRYSQQQARGFAAAPGGSKKKTLKEIWLGDKGAWPVIVVIIFALGLSTFWGTRTLLTNPDVRISKEARQEILRRGKLPSTEVVEEE